jgi:hypothetical protein
MPPLERLAGDAPVVMVFEDLHHADQGLFDFIEYLLDWSAEHPLFLLTVARPDVAERRAGWPPDHPRATRVTLAPMDDGAMDELLRALVPGLPDDVRARIAAMRERLGLNDPLPVQYLRFLGGAVRGDFGVSIWQNQPVLDLILDRMPATLQLTGAALLLSVGLSIPIGIISATRR